MAFKGKSSLANLIAMLGDYLKKNPDDNNVYCILGSSYREFGEIPTAFKIHKNLLAKPDLKKKFRMQVMIELARDLYYQGSYTKASEILNDLLKTDSKNIDALFLSLKIFRKNEEHENALKTAERIPDIDPKLLSDVYTEYASDQIRKRDFSRARKYLKRAISKWPSNMDALILVGDAELKDGKYRSAIESYFNAIQANSSYTPLILERVENAFFQGNNFDELRTKLRESLSENIDNSDIHFGLGKFLLKKRLVAEARKEFKKALEFNPTHFEAREQLFNILLEENNTEGALKKELKDLFGEIRKNLFYYCTKCTNREKSIKWKCPSCGSFNAYEKGIFLF